MNNAPIILFGFNRPDTIYKVLDALTQAIGFDTSKLIIYLDGPREDIEILACEEVLEVCKAYNRKFKNICIKTRNENYGLAKNIYEGVSEVLKKYDSAIILEDDIIIGKNFLKFMNECLAKYKKNNEIWHISGWSPEGMVVNEDIYVSKMMFCWGWATWKDKWQFYNKDAERLLKKWTYRRISEFNYETAANNWNQVLYNYIKKKNTWAIFWYASIFENKGLCINPKESLVENIGFDGKSTSYHNKKYKKINLKASNKAPYTNINSLNELEITKKCLKNFFEKDISKLKIFVFKFLVFTKTYNYFFLRVLNSKYETMIKNFFQ